MPVQLNLFDPPMSKTYVDDNEYRIEAKRTDFGAAPFRAEVDINDKRLSRRIQLLRMATPWDGTWFEVIIKEEGPNPHGFSVAQYEPDSIYLGSYLRDLTDEGRARFFEYVLYLNKSLRKINPYFDNEDYFGWNIENGLRFTTLVRDRALQSAEKETAILRQVA